MLIKVSRVILSQALQQVIRAVSSSNPIPILSGIKFTAHSDGVRLISSNTSMMIKVEIPLSSGEIEVIRTGSIVVPAKYFADIVHRLPLENVTLEMSEHLIITISCGHAVYRLCGMDPAEFPESSEVNKDICFGVQSSALKKVIRQVGFAVSTSESRPVLTGISCQAADSSHIRFLATDGVRLATRFVEVGTKQELFFAPIIIPGKNLSELAKVLTAENEAVEIRIGDRQIIFKTKNMHFYSALIEGSYPSVDNIIPASHTTDILVNTEDILSAIERVSLLAGDGNLIRLNASTDHVELISKTAEIGDVYEKVGIQDMNGESVQIAFNGKYMRDILSSANSTNTRLKFSGKLNPIIIEPIDGSQSIYMLTPIRSNH